jgi:hypothetical protein
MLPREPLKGLVSDSSARPPSKAMHVVCMPIKYGTLRAYARHQSQHPAVIQTNTSTTYSKLSEGRSLFAAPGSSCLSPDLPISM